MYQTSCGRLEIIAITALISSLCFACKVRSDTSETSNLSENKHRAQQGVCKKWTARGLTANKEFVSQGKHDVYRIQIATQEQLGVNLPLQAVFDAARKRLTSYKQYPKENIDTLVCAPNSLVSVNTTVVQFITVLGVVWETANRMILPIEDNTNDVERWGFMVGSLYGHKERGVVRYTLEWDHKLNALYYQIETNSEPAGILSNAGYPVVRHYQVSYSNESLEYMKKMSILDAKESLLNK
jgi:uncharacterized protein (UPF0548 family)